MANPPNHDTGKNGKASSDFEQRLESLEAKRKKAASFEAGKSLNEGYRLVASLIGGVLGGAGIGWLIDYFAGSFGAHTKPAGLIGGLLIGTAVSIFNAIHVSARMSKQALKDHPASAVPFDDDED